MIVARIAASTLFFYAWPLLACPSVMVGQQKIDLEDLVSPQYCEAFEKSRFPNRSGNTGYLTYEPKTESYRSEQALADGFEGLRKHLGTARPTQGLLNQTQYDIAARATNFFLHVVHKDQVTLGFQAMYLTSKNAESDKLAQIAGAALKVEDDVYGGLYRRNYDGVLERVMRGVQPELLALIDGNDFNSVAVQKVVRRTQFDLSDESLVFLNQIRSSLARDEFVRANFGPAYTFRAELIRFLRGEDSPTAGIGWDVNRAVLLEAIYKRIELVKSQIISRPELEFDPYAIRSARLPEVRAIPRNARSTPFMDDIVDQVLEKAWSSVNLQVR